MDLEKVWIQVETARSKSRLMSPSPAADAPTDPLTLLPDEIKDIQHLKHSV